MKFKLDTSSEDFDEIFFNRPVSRIQSSWVGLVTSKNTPIKTISYVYQIIDLLGHNISLVADAKQSQGALPADTLLKSKKTPGYSNADEGIAALKDCKIIIFLAGKELNSDMELFITQLLSEYKGLFVTDYPKIFYKNEFITKRIILADNSKIESNYKFGLNHSAGLVLAYSKENECPVVFFDNKQIICVDNTQENLACVINTKDVMPKEIFTGFMTGLIADKKMPLESDWLKYCQAAGYLSRMMLSMGAGEVKKYLNDRF